LQRFFKQAKRPKIKEALGVLLKTVQDSLAELEKADKDPYIFDDQEEHGGAVEPDEEKETGDIVEEKILETDEWLKQCKHAL